MKKIKSKLVYINPSYKIHQRAEKSPSPDNKRQFKIQNTSSPVKQVEQYCKARNTIGYYCTEVQQKKRLGKHAPDSNRNKNLSAFSLDSSHEQVDIDSLSQSIKLKSPSSQQFQPSEGQFSLNKQYFSSRPTNQVFHTPKSKNNSFKHEFPQYASEWKNNSNDVNQKKDISSLSIQNTAKIDRNLNFGAEYYSAVKADQRPRRQSGSNNKSKKKLEVYTPSLNACSKQKPTKDSSQKYNQQHPEKQTFSLVYRTQQNRKIEPSLKQEKNVNESKDIFIRQLQQQLNQKDKQIQKMSTYVKQYEKLGTKNKRMQNEMSQILSKLYELKQKKHQIQESSREAPSHNQPSQDQQLLSPQTPIHKQPQSHKHSLTQHLKQEQPQSEIWQQNIHEHKKSLTDDYIKIYDDLQSSGNLNDQEEEQSYKPNMIGYSSGKPYKNDNAVYSHRKMLSVGARLKESLKAKNQDFKARFDDSILLSSSSSEFLSNQVMSPTEKERRQFNFSKKRIQNLKTEETQEGSISLMQNESLIQLESSIEPNNTVDNLQQEWNSRNIQTDQSLPLESSKKIEQEETTAKKSKVKFLIKKRNEENTLTDKNVDYLVETNKKLTSIIENLMKSHDSMFDEVKRMSEKNEIYAQKMSQIQEEFYLLKVNFGQLTAVSSEILATVKDSLSDKFAFKKTLNSIEEKLGKLYQSINQNTRELKKDSSQKQIWMENNNASQMKPFLLKATSFGKSADGEISQARKDEERVRNYNGEDYRQPASPSFTHLQESASFMNESFKLSHSDRSNPSNSRFNYNLTVQDQIISSSMNHSSMKSSKKEFRFEQESKILIKQDSIDGSSESNLLSYRSNVTTPLVQVQSGRGTSEHSKSGTSKDKMISESSEIRINFDDLYEDPNGDKQNHKYQKFQIIDHDTDVKSSRSHANNGPQQESITMMRSSFGPIIQKQMSRSQKGDSYAGQIQDQVHEVTNDSPQRAYNRPRQNSSINIFFSSDSICKSSKIIHNFANETSLTPAIESNQSSQSSSASFSCKECNAKDQQIQRFDTEASQMRKMISEISEEREGLQKLVKSKIEIIDSLEISLRELHTLTSFEPAKSKNQTASFAFEKNSNKINSSGQNSLPSKEHLHSWYKTAKDFPFIEKSEQKKSILDMKSPKFNQIEDLLPISARLSKQVPFQRLQNLKSIQLQIQHQLRKEKQLEKEFNEKNFRIEDNTLDWGRGSFSNVDEFRQKSFIKTKAILVKLICVIRELISEGNQSLKK